MKKTNLVYLALILLVSGCKSFEKKENLNKNHVFSEKELLQKQLAEKADINENTTRYMEIALEYQNKELYDDALDIYETVIKKYPTSVLAPEAYFQSARIYKGMHQYNEAFNRFSKILKKYPTYKRFNDVIESQFQIASELMSGERPYYFGMIPGLKDYDAAIKFYKSIASNAPYSQYAARALFESAQGSLNHGKKENAIESLETIIQEYLDSEYTPKAYMLLGETYESMILSPEHDQKVTKEALNSYKDFLTLFAGNEKTPIEDIKKAEEKITYLNDILAKGHFLTGNFFYERRNNPKAALIFYNEAISTAPESETAQNAYEQIKKIRNHVIPPKTWVDKLFGWYEDPDFPKEEEE